MPTHAERVVLSFVAETVELCKPPGWVLSIRHSWVRKRTPCPTPKMTLLIRPWRNIVPC